MQLATQRNTESLGGGAHGTKSVAVAAVEGIALFSTFFLFPPQENGGGLATAAVARGRRVDDWQRARVADGGCIARVFVRREGARCSLPRKMAERARPNYGSWRAARTDRQTRILRFRFFSPTHLPGPICECVPTIPGAGSQRCGVYIVCVSAS